MISNEREGERWWELLFWEERKWLLMLVWSIRGEAVPILESERERREFPEREACFCLTLPKSDKERVLLSIKRPDCTIIVFFHAALLAESMITSGNDPVQEQSAATVDPGLLLQNPGPSIQVPLLYCTMHLLAQDHLFNLRSFTAPDTEDCH